MANLLEHNRVAWNEEVKKGNVWTVPVTKNEIDAASEGECKILLTPTKHVPEEWMGDIRGKRVLCLASGGGQQGPLIASAGAKVTVFDNSDEQLKRDEEVAEKFELEIKTEQGNMQDLSIFAGKSFDMIIHPVSKCFIDSILPVWKECYRVLDNNGVLLSGFVNPIMYMIDWEIADRTKRCELIRSIPYSDVKSLSPDMTEKYVQEKIPFEFGHSLTDQIQGQIEAGFVISGFYEDGGEELLDHITEVFIATRAVKMG